MRRAYGSHPLGIGPIFDPKRSTFEAPLSAYGRLAFYALLAPQGLISIVRKGGAGSSNPLALAKRPPLCPSFPRS